MKKDNKQTKYFLAIKISPKRWGRFKVQGEVYTYIQQLENAVRHPRKSKIKELYPNRFNL